MSLDDYINKLPKEYQELARKYIGILTDMTFEELEKWTLLLSEGDWQSAYKKLVKKMTADEVIIETRRLNAQLKALNKDNADMVTMQRQLILEILIIGIMILRNKVEEQ